MDDLHIVPLLLTGKGECGGFRDVSFNPSFPIFSDVSARPEADLKGMKYQGTVLTLQ